jgi:hypothetical protein
MTPVFKIYLWILSAAQVISSYLSNSSANILNEISPFSINMMLDDVGTDLNKHSNESKYNLAEELTAVKDHPF